MQVDLSSEEMRVVRVALLARQAECARTGINTNLAYWEHEARMSGQLLNRLRLLDAPSLIPA